MANCVIHVNGANEIRYFLRDAVRYYSKSPDRLNFHGSNGKHSGLNVTLFSFIWTNDEANPIYGAPDENGVTHQIGWDKTVSEITPALEGTEIAKSTHSDLLAAIAQRRQIANLTYAQVEGYVENNVTDLASAKAYLKLLSKVVLAVIKIQDKG